MSSDRSDYTLCLRNDGVFNQCFGDPHGTVLDDWNIPRIWSIYDSYTAPERRVLFYMKYCRTAMRMNMSASEVLLSDIDRQLELLFSAKNHTDKTKILLLSIMTQSQYAALHHVAQTCKKHCRKGVDKIFAVIRFLWSAGIFFRMLPEMFVSGSDFYFPETTLRIHQEMPDLEAHLISKYTRSSDQGEEENRAPMHVP